MKPFLISVCATAALASAVLAGSEQFAGKTTLAAQPCPTWYADREWNVSLWGAYAFTANDYATLNNANNVPGPGRSDHDTYLETDHAWGGGIDAKYFFTQYFGVGMEGYALDVRQSYPNVSIPFYGVGNGAVVETAHSRQAIGSLIGTFTLRFPIGCSRFAPYAAAGGGVLFGGGQKTTIKPIPDGVATFRSGSTTEAVGQFGGGVEVRLTPHIGLINDFTWNVVNGPNNDFGHGSVRHQFRVLVRQEV